MSAEIGVGADAPGLGSFLNRWVRGRPCSRPPVRSLSAAHGDPARQCPAAGAQLGPCRAGGQWGLAPLLRLPARLLGPTAVPTWEKV